MFHSTPALWQAILWLYIGAAAVLIIGHRLPNEVRRPVAALCALLALRSWLVGGGQVEIFWEPLNLFRAGPVLQADDLSLLGGMTLTIVTIALVLGIRGTGQTAWHGLFLALLAGSLWATAAANLLALALGSALMDLALLAMALSAKDETGRAAWRMAVPGLVSTYLLFLSALRMDTQMGHPSLLARNLSSDALLLLGLAGMWRLMVFPLHPRQLGSPQSAATAILPAGVGIYLLVRAESLGPVLGSHPWTWLFAAGGLLAGGVMVWAGSVAARREESPGGVIKAILPGVIVQQGGYALAFVLWVGADSPWPLASLPLILGILTIGWESTLEQESGEGEGWLAGITRRVRSALGQWSLALSARLRTPTVERALRYGMALPFILALLSAVGGPLTPGARVRWPLYAHLLHAGGAAPLLTLLIADTLLVAGMPLAWDMLRQNRIRPGGGPLLALPILTLPLILLGVAPGLVGAPNLPPITLPPVSVWGLGLIVILPWLIGIWFARFGEQAEGILTTLHAVANLDWLFRAAGWVGRQVVGILYWLGLVGEGDGWWGWALAVLALGVAFLAVR